MNDMKYLDRQKNKVLNTVLGILMIGLALTAFQSVAGELTKQAAVRFAVLDQINDSEESTKLFIQDSEVSIEEEVLSPVFEILKNLEKGDSE